HVAAVRPLREARGEPAGDEFVEEVAHILAVPNPGKRRVLTPQAIPTVQRHGHEEARLARREAEGFERADPILERHRSQEIVRSVSSKDMWMPSFESTARASARRVDWRRAEQEA